MAILIAIFLMLEAWILNASYAFRGDQDVINYISFASTIASLLLAVLAIIYGFVQADGQQKSASSMETQLNSMRGAQASLSETAVSLRNHLSAIASTTSVLQSISESIESNNAKLVTLEGGLTSLQQSQAPYFAKRVREDQVEMTTKQEERGAIRTAVKSADHAVWAAEQILTKSTYQADLLGYALFKAYEAAGKNSIDLFQFLEKFYGHPLKNDTYRKSSLVETVSIGYQLTQALAAIGFLKSNHIIERDPWEIEISEENLAHLERISSFVGSGRGTASAAALIDEVKW